jgi:hypothetical protein
VLPAHSSSASVRPANYTVSGTIKTPNGTNLLANDAPVSGLRAIVMDEDILFDDVMGTTSTSSTGFFSVNFVDNLEAPDIYINLEYVTPVIDGRVAEVRAVHSDSAPIVDQNLQSFVHTDIAAGTLALGTLRSHSTAPNILPQIRSALANIRTTFAGWGLPSDINIEARTTNGASFVDGTGSYISISFEDYDHPGAGNAAFSDMHHELFHWAAFRAYGNRWPFTTCSPASHTIFLESCSGFAMLEGSAEWWATVSAAPDQKNAPPPLSTWRGADSTGTNNAGDIVEGAYAGAFGSLPSAAALEVLLSDAPDSAVEFRDAYLLRFGSTNSSAQTLLTTLATWGMPYTRARILGFQQGPPPNTAPPDPGNFRLLQVGSDSIAFARGSVRPQVAQLSGADLLLEGGIGALPATSIRVGTRLANPGVVDNSLSGFSFSAQAPWTNVPLWHTELDLDSSYDLVVQAGNAQLWFDNFLPSFQGDSVSNANTNEKWLKRSGTWFTSGTNFLTNDNVGFIMVDNTPPAITNIRP